MDTMQEVIPPSKLDRYVIILNGPPGSGKDTAAGSIAAFLTSKMPYLNPRKMKMAQPLKDGAHKLFDAFHSPEYYDGPDGYALKSVPSGDFFGLSPREAYIKLSEEFCKSIHPQFFGYLARKRMVRLSSSQCFIFSDGGFVDEWVPIVEYVGAKKVLVIELDATNKTFEGDSRGYIGEQLKQLYPKITVRKIYNTIGDNQDRELFRIMCQGAVQSFLNIKSE